MSRKFILLPGLAFVGLVALMFVVASGGSPVTTAEAQTVLATPTRTPVPLEGLGPTSDCMNRLTADSPVGTSVQCQLRVYNYGPAIADDVTLRFADSTFIISNLAYRFTPSGPLTAYPGTWAANTNFGPVVDIPVSGQLYATFTLTKTSSTQYAPKKPRFCADALNYAETCSTGVVS